MAASAARRIVPGGSGRILVVPREGAAMDLLPAASLFEHAAAPWLGLVASYLLGAVPFGFCMVKVLRGVDLRDMGSGNIGATNAMRVLGRPLGITAFLLDCLKGFVPVTLFASAFAAGGSSWWPVLYGAAAVLGHVFPVYLGFKGGKAVATGAGALIGLDWPTFLLGGVVWLVVVQFSRMVSAASLAMGIAFPIAAAWRASTGEVGWEVVWGAALLALLILVRHRSNIARILARTEPRIGQRGDRDRRTPTHA